jgi:hypothetical protein
VVGIFPIISSLRAKSLRCHFQWKEFWTIANEEKLVSNYLGHPIIPNKTLYPTYKPKPENGRTTDKNIEANIIRGEIRMMKIINNFLKNYMY